MPNAQKRKELAPLIQGAIKQTSLEGRGTQQSMTQVLEINI